MCGAAKPRRKNSIHRRPIRSVDQWPNNEQDQYVSGTLAPEARGRELGTENARARERAFASVQDRAPHDERHSESPANKSLGAALLCCGALLLPLATLANDAPLAAADRLAPKAEPRVWSAGKPPAFALDSLSGGSKSLNDYQGRIVLVHFFATWCEPCREEIASLQCLGERVSAQPLVLAIDVGEVDIRVRRFFEKLPVDFPVLLDRDKVAAKNWGVDQLPMTFLLDGTLIPRFVIVGDFDWDRADIVRLTAELSATQKRNGPRAGG
jgi:thiol-disulfide isomerase/thioredoxin